MSPRSGAESEAKDFDYNRSGLTGDLCDRCGDVKTAGSHDTLVVPCCVTEQKTHGLTPHLYILTSSDPCKRQRYRLLLLLLPRLLLAPAPAAPPTTTTTTRTSETGQSPRVGSQLFHDTMAQFRRARASQLHNSSIVNRTNAGLRCYGTVEPFFFGGEFNLGAEHFVRVIVCACAMVVPQIHGANTMETRLCRPVIG